jgi:RHS repeat-associated protein
VRLARVVHGDSTGVYLELGDHLGSTSVVLDRATGELVQRDTAYAYGAAESSYRPAKFGEFREDYRFTGKEDDVEVGLIYFGKRYYAPLLGRWISADPLAVHAPGQADLNLYAYVHGRVLAAVDAIGLRATVSGDKASDKKHWQQQEAQVLHGLQQLTADRLGLVNVNGEMEVRILATAPTASGRTIGTRLVRDIIRSGETVNIAFADPSTLTHGPAQGSTASLDGKQVNYDPTTSLALYERSLGSHGTTKEKIPAFIALGHELTHIWRKWNGVDSARGNMEMYKKHGSDWNVVSNSWVGPTGRQYTERVSREEAETVGFVRCERIRGFRPTENGLRGEHGIAPRAAYATPDEKLSKQRVTWNPLFDTTIEAVEEEL